VLDAIHLESLGKATITIIGDRFQKAAELHSQAGGLPDLPFVVELMPSEGRVQHDVEGFVAENLLAIVSALTEDIKPVTSKG
jgi:hypothetical protein